MLYVDEALGALQHLEDRGHEGALQHLEDRDHEAGTIHA